MAKLFEYSRLEDLWFESDPDALRCCFCQSKIGSAPLIRTFRLHFGSGGNESFGYSKLIKTPLNEEIILYDRHLQCLLQSGIKYSAISHVWDPDISRIQGPERLLSQPLRVRHLVIQIPIFVYRGLLASGEISELDEIWHDYISVPQWSDDLKDRILLAIPDIFASAHITTVHFEDLQEKTVQILNEGQTTDERLKAITDICNLKWFTRMWTAMEFVRSRHIVAMDGEGKVRSRRNDPLFLDQIICLWNNELEKHESVHHLEARAEIGKNLVPWNLGPLQEMRERETSVFGQAFTLLSRRRCRSKRDFLHALFGLVVPTSGRTLEHDFNREYARLARLCLAAGDYSPFLMAPRVEDERWEIIQGFNDVSIWPLGAGKQLPSFHKDFSFEDGDFENGDPILTLRELGIVTKAHSRLMADPITNFAQDASIVLNVMGPDLDSFVDTLGCRLYDEEPEFIKRRLTAESQNGKLSHTPQERYAKRSEHSWPIEGPGGAQWVADAMTLSHINPGGSAGEPISRIQWLDGHGGTIHFGNGSSLVAVSCTGCHRSFIYRAGLFDSAENVRGSIAYNIPGLKYQYSHREGVGIVVKDGRVVGRMAWATPACECLEIRNVTVKMPALPDPNPRPYKLNLAELAR